MLNTNQMILFHYIPSRLSKKWVQTIILCLMFAVVSIPGFSQDSDYQSSVDVSGEITATTEGLSIVPALALGEPAAIYNLSVGRRFKFEPDFRMSLKGKPWSLGFFFRYDLLKTENFNLRIGTHPAIMFATTPAIIDGTESEIIQGSRVWGNELISSYFLSNRVSIGTYYIYGHGIEATMA